MADFSTYTSQFRADGPAYRDARNNKVTKRTRQKLSCMPCANRKLKCDRGHPCETCVKRSTEDACLYERMSASSGNGRTQTQEKLVNLEQLVRQMMDSETVSSRELNNQATAQPRPDHTPPYSGCDYRGGESDQPHGNKRVEQSVWSLRSPSHTPMPPPQYGSDHTPPYLNDENHSYGARETRYVGSTHWSAILENIQELKVAVHAFPSTHSDEDDSPGVEIAEGEILFGSTVHYSIQQILSESLPPKIQVDRRLSSFFKTKIMIIPYIHTACFQRQYEEFWKDPSGTSPLWISMLFSLCCIAATIGKATDSEPSYPEGQQHARVRFLKAAAQSLVLGDYTRPQPYVVEALALYAQCKYMHTLDPSRELCIIISTVCRLAYMMGYHRDPDNYGNFTVFEGEMRRRAWSACRQFDLMVSFQFGLPSNIHVDSLDTRCPRNLLDSDFDENTKVLPPSRPDTEPTPILYFVVKHNLLRGFTRVCNHALSLKTKSQKEIMELDAELRQMYSSVPESLRIRPMAQSFADPPFLIITRLYIAFLHQKSLCILHRGHMAQGHEYSTKACVDAAMTIITHLIDINKEFEVGGQLHRDRWALSSFNMNDFLLAVMILCLSLSMWKKGNPEKHVYEEDFTAGPQLDLLKQAQALCIEKADMSKESRRVAAAVKTVLAQLEPQTYRTATTKETRPFSNHNLEATPAVVVEQHSLEDPATISPSAYHNKDDRNNTTATTLSHDNGISSLSLDDPQHISSVFEPPPSSSSPSLGSQLNPFEDIFNDFENMDWTYLDQCLVGSNEYDFVGESDWVNSRYTR